ncbi:MAG: hypothetical protein R3F54_11790 [Alphaproteobacteria bacterium]
MADQAIRGFKINTILDRLAVDMLGLMERGLTLSEPDRDRFYLGILLTLSKQLYVSQLLYRDFRAAGDQQWHRYKLPGNKTAKVHEQSLVYLHQVLMRRLRLARRLKHEPGNMHLLLGQLARFGTRGDGWAAVELRRDPALEARDGAEDFRTPLAAALDAQRSALGDDFGDEARRRREEYGPLWLIRPPDAAEMPEEMSWFDVIDAVPVPLAAGFTGDVETQRLVVRVLDSLNERYTLLRSCGLDPERWHERDTPSIAKLRDLKRLRQQAEDYLRQSIEDEAVRAYRRAFAELAELAGSGGEIAGFDGFDDFATSEVGMAMLRYPVQSLDDAIGGEDDDDDRSRHDLLADEDAVDIEQRLGEREAAGAWVTRLITDRPGWFDPAMRYFFEQVLGRGRPLYPEEGDEGVLFDPDFLALVAGDDELAELDDEALAAALYRRAQKLIKRGLNRQASASA